MTAPDRIWLQHPMADEPDEPDWTDPDFEITWCSEPIQDEDVEYIRKGAFPVERLKIESEKPRDAAEAALTAELRWVINEVLSLVEGEQ